MHVLCLYSYEKKKRGKQCKYGSNSPTVRINYNCWKVLKEKCNLGTNSCRPGLDKVTSKTYKPLCTMML